MKERMLTFFGTLGILNEDQKISITNVTVMLFCAITAFRSLFSGLTFDNTLFHWKVEGLDFSATLPLLFSLLNYHSRRTVVNESKKQSSSKKENNNDK